MIQSRNKYLQFMLVLLAARAIARGPCLSWGRLFCSMGWGKYAVLQSWCCTGVPPVCFLVYRRWVAPLPVVGQLSNVGALWLVGAMAVVYVGEFLLGKVLDLPAEPFMTKLFADKSIPDVILTLLAVFILAPLNEEILFRGVMLNAEGSPHKSAIA